MNYSNVVNRASATPRKNEPRPSQLSNSAHQGTPEQSAATDNAEEMKAEATTKRKRADDIHEDQRDERATGNKKKPTEVVCMSPETGTIFTIVVNLELSDEQRENIDAEDILRETKEIFDSYSIARREEESALTQDAVQEDLNQ